MTGDPGLRLARDGAVAELVLARPLRQNAMAQAMWRMLFEHCRTIAGDPSVRVVVVRGEGPSFSAGADIAEFAEVFADEAAAHDYNELVQDALAALAILPQPTIAQITGNCIGGGCGLAVGLRPAFRRRRRAPRHHAGAARPRLQPGRDQAPARAGRRGPGQGSPVLGPAAGRRGGLADRAAGPRGGARRARRDGARLRRRRCWRSPATRSG